MKFDWEHRKVFVTGASGLLGAWLVEELLQRKAEVICLIRDFVPGSRLFDSGLANRVTRVEAALEDFTTIQRILNEYEVEIVFHLGAQTIVGTANRNPLSTFESNIKGTWSLFEACRTISTVKRIVFASSDKAYGDSAVLPYKEETPLKGQFPYDVSKSCADLIAQSYFHSFGLPVAITRCGNFYGGGDLHFNRLIPGTIRSVLKGEAPIIRSDGSYIRDYLYVKDGVEAYLLLAEQMLEKSLCGQAFNFSYENPKTVLEITRLLLALMGREDLEPVILNEIRCEIQNQSLSSEKARQVLGWKPHWSLEASLKETIAWYGEHLKVHEPSC